MLNWPRLRKHCKIIIKISITQTIPVIIQTVPQDRPCGYGLCNCGGTTCYGPKQRVKEDRNEPRSQKRTAQAMHFRSHVMYRIYGTAVLSCEKHCAITKYFAQPNVRKPQGSGLVKDVCTQRKRFVQHLSTSHLTKETPSGCS